MGRYENENTDHLVLPNKDQIDAVEYGIDGQEGANTDIVCAKTIKHELSDKKTYFVLCNEDNRLYNPHESMPRYNLKLWRLKSVTRTTFDIYISFLNNKYNSLLLQAERGL